VAREGDHLYVVVDVSPLDAKARKVTRTDIEIDPPVATSRPSDPATPPGPPDVRAPRPGRDPGPQALGDLRRRGDLVEGDLHDPRSQMNQRRSAIAIWMLVVAFALELCLLILSKISLPMLALIHVGAFSAIAFVAFAWDKLRATRGASRISEATLFTISILGGALGGLAAMLFAHHKTKRPLFWIVLCGSLFAHVTLVGWLFISR